MAVVVANLLFETVFSATVTGGIVLALYLYLSDGPVFSTDESVTIQDESQDD